MDTQTVLLPLVPLLPFIVSAIDQWHKWQKEGKVRRAYLTVGLLLLSLILAWALLYVGGKQRQAQLAEVRRDAAAQGKQLSDQLHVHNQDLEARLVAQEDRSRLIAEGCISDPKLRQQAKAVHPKLQRGVSEELHVSDKATGVVNRAPKKGHEPLRPQP
jgi:cell division protein FtsB